MKYNLNKEETKILKAFEKDELKLSSDFQKKKNIYIQAAKNTLEKLKYGDNIEFNNKSIFASKIKKPKPTASLGLIKH